jgi:dephospho-CoA kinase
MVESDFIFSGETTMQLVIGLCGKAGSGKDTTAQYISQICQTKNVHCETIHFAKALKDIAKNVFGWDGNKDERGRRLLQVIGTDCARAYNENFWIEKWENQILEILKNNKNCIILSPDVRFDNEAKIIHKYRGCIIQMIGRKYDLGCNENHISEQGLRKELIDFTIDNSDSLEYLQQQVENFSMRFLTN